MADVGLVDQDYDEPDDGLHCYHPETHDAYGEETGEEAECVCCECCCTCLACEYGPRDGMLLTEEQRAPIAAWRPAEAGEDARHG